MNLGIIGYGTRSSHIADCMLRFGLGVRITAIADPDGGKCRTMLKERGIEIDPVSIYSDADEMLNRESLDGVLIGTRCTLHTRMAMKVLAKRLPLFLEKPVATCMEDLLKLKRASDQAASETVVSFPLRVTPLVLLAKEIIQSGKIGTVEHVQAYNNVPYGGVYYHNWYRDEREAGGLILQKATHDFDYINSLLDRKPIAIGAMKSKQIFRGDKPEGLKCGDCADNESCPESPFVLTHLHHEEVLGDMCSFARDTGNEDSSSVLIRYEDGMHVAYSQNFFARKAAGARGARLFGYSGTIEFDWFKDELHVYMHHTPRVETYRMDTANASHGGGDAALAYNFIRVMQGREKSVAPLESGLVSALMCLKAEKSVETETFQAVGWE